ncbi:MAG: VOC family protein [Pseudomonadota bacterium]
MSATWKSPERGIVTPMIIVKGAPETIRFAEAVFGATRVRRDLLRQDGSLWNAEIRIGDDTIMFGEPEGDEAFPGFVYIHVPDADAVFAKALEAGATPMLEPQDQFYGEHDGGVMDPQGNIWWISSHREDLTDDEIERRARAFEAAKHKPA